MKKICLLLTMIFVMVLIQANGQQNSFSVALSENSLHFAGASAAPSITYSTGSSNNPYGSRSDFGWGITFAMNHITTYHLFYGIELGYTGLKSKMETNKIIVDGASPVDATGKLNLHIQEISLFPNTGYRFAINNNIKLDAGGGLEIAPVLKNREQTRVRADNGNEYSFNKDRKNINTDIRARVQLKLNYQRTYLKGSYAWGCKNYLEGYIGGTTDAVSRVLSVGVGYSFF
ncbi:MAG: outer membrane beta-barrel protein [Niabella sp.]